MLTVLFIAWGIFASWRSGYQVIAADVRYSLRQKLEMLPKVGPFLLIIAGVLYVLYGGIATPSEAAGVGALFCLLLVILVYRMRRPGGSVAHLARRDARGGDDHDDHRGGRPVQLHDVDPVHHPDARM